MVNVNTHLPLFVGVHIISFVRVSSSDPYIYLLSTNFVTYVDLNAATYIHEEMLTYSHVFNLSGSINTRKCFLFYGILETCFRLTSEGVFTTCHVPGLGNV
jgi:hypothetical protein